MKKWAIGIIFLGLLAILFCVEIAEIYNEPLPEKSMLIKIPIIQ